VAIYLASLGITHILPAVSEITNCQYRHLLLGPQNRLHVIASAAKHSKTLNGDLDYEIASASSLACARDKPRNDTRNTNVQTIM